MAIININIGDEYKIRHEEEKEFKGSLFEDLYYSAARSIDEIIAQSQKPNGRNSYFKEHDYNNLIAFIGERGTGKSSSMISFADALLNKYPKNVENSFFKEFDNLIDTSFLSIGIVDPSLFSYKDTLFEIIVSKMFLRFQQVLSGDEVSFDRTFITDVNAKRNLIKSFQTVFENLKTIHNEKRFVYQREAIEALANLAEGTNLRFSFHELVKQYLSFFKKENGFLLIVIDDFDLKIPGAYQMLEDMRQFLIQKNIIILLACKMEQLEDSIQLTIVKEYKELIEIGEKEGGFLSDSPKDKAYKYLNKLIPIDHRKMTPKDILDYKDGKHFNIFNRNKILVSTDNVQEGILKLLYSKSGLFLSRPEYSHRGFIPNTIREIANLVGVINSLNENSLEDIKKYLHTEVAKNFGRNEIALFRNLESHDLNNINEYIIFWLRTYFEKYLERLRRGTIERQRGPIVRYNSFAEVSYHLSFFEEMIPITNKTEKNLIEYIKIYYSLRLNSLNVNHAETLGKVVGSEMINLNHNIFPKESRDNNFSRDVFEVRGLKWLQELHAKGDISSDDFLWISFFISNFGKQELARKNEGIFIQSVDFITFNSLSFIVNLLNADQVYYKTFFLINDYQDSKLIYDVAEWRKGLTKTYLLFFNIEFFQEFLSELESFVRNYKDALGDYSLTLKVYLTKGIRRALERLDEKYPYLELDIDYFMSNPLFKYWGEDNEENQRLTLLLNGLFTLSKDPLGERISVPKQVSEIANQVLKKYDRYFDENGNYNSLGAKQAMNRLIERFSNYPEIHKQLKSFRILMDSKLQEGLSDIHSYVTNLSNSNG